MDCCKMEMPSVARSRKQNLVLSKKSITEIAQFVTFFNNLLQALPIPVQEEFCRLISIFLSQETLSKVFFRKSGTPFHQRPKERLPIAVKFSREIPDLSCWLICQGLQEVFWETRLPFSHLFHHMCSF